MPELSAHESRIEIDVEDGLRLPVRAFGAASPAKLSVVALHGMMSHAGWFHALGAELAQRGGLLLAADRRGSGQSRHLPGLDSADRWVEDVRELVRVAHSYSNRVVLLGWCGGARTALAAAASGVEVTDILLAAPALFFSPYLQRRFDALSGHVGAELPLPFEPLDDFSLAPEVRQFIEADTLRWNAVPRPFLSPSKVVLERALAGLPSIGSPIRCLLATDDRLIDNTRTGELMAGRQVERISGAHAIVLEQPRRLAELLLE